jgi:hypothetical protein
VENLTPLASRLKPVVTRRAGLALGLWGEAGIGKSYAAQRLLAAATCRSFSVHATVPLGELLEALPRPSRLPLWARRSVERLERGEHVEPSTAADALAALLAALAPVVLHIEDLHEAAPERQGLWQALAGRVKRSRGVALLVTSRSLPPEPFEAERLAPLCEGASRALLEAEVGASLSQEASAWIYGRALGNPLFTLEYFRYLARQGYLWSDGKRWHWREPPEALMPVTVEALIERATVSAKVSEAAREALEAAAMLSLDAPAGLWPAVAGLPQDLLAAATLELERQGLFRGGTFAHPLFREVTRQHLGAAKRRELARRALAALEEDARTAAGFVEDAGLEPHAARALLEKAAAQAEAAGNGAQVGRFLVRMVAYAKGEGRGQLAFRAAQALRPFDLVEATRLAEQATGLTPDNREACYLLSELLAMQGHIRRAEEVLARLPQPLQRDVQMLAQLAKLRAIAGNAAAAVELWQAHPELQALQDPELSYQVAFALNDQGDAQKGLIVAQAALSNPHLTALMRARLLSACFGAQYYLGNYRAAEGYIEEALATARRENSLRGMASCLFNLAYVHAQLCAFKRRLTELEEALTLFGALGDARMCAHTQVCIGAQLSALGEPERAEDMLLESLAVLERFDVSVALFDCKVELSTLYLEWRPPHGGVLALKHAYASLRHAEALNNPRSRLSGLCVAASAEVRCGSPQRGLELAQEAFAAATSLDHPYMVCLALLAQGLALEALGQFPEARDTLAAAQRLTGRPGMAREACDIGLELDRLSGDAGSAAQKLEWYQAHGLMYGVQRVYRYFPTLISSRAQARPEPLPKAFRLELLGPLRLVQDGVAQAVRGHKRKELLAGLLEARIAGRSEVAQLELLYALYPDETEDSAASSLKQLVFQLRKSLGANIILRTAGGYALGSVASDVEDFFKTGDTTLWRGVYREDLSEGDETVASALYHALQGRATELLDSRPTEATRLGRLLLQADPYNAQTLRLTLEALRVSGNQRAIAKLYEASRETLAEVGEMLPEAWGDFLKPPAA